MTIEQIQSRLEQLLAGIVSDLTTTEEAAHDTLREAFGPEARISITKEIVGPRAGELTLRWRVWDGQDHHQADSLEQAVAAAVRARAAHTTDQTEAKAIADDLQAKAEANITAALPDTAPLDAAFPPDPADRLKVQAIIKHATPPADQEWKPGCIAVCTDPADTPLAMHGRYPVKKVTEELLVIDVAGNERAYHQSRFEYSDIPF